MDVEGLSGSCSGLGHQEEDENGCPTGGYIKGQYCSDSLGDLLRFVRCDQDRLVFKQIYKWRIVPKHLLPIIVNFHDDRRLLLDAVKILVFLTMPVVHLSSSNDVMEYLCELKSAVTSSRAVAVIVMTLLESPLENLQSQAFTEQDWKLLQLVLTLFRNLLAVRDPHNSGDGFVQLLFEENVMEIVLILCNCPAGPSSRFLRRDGFLLVEILSFLLTGRDPAEIADHRSIRVSDSASSLRSFVEEEEEHKKKKNAGRLRSNYSGTFTRFSMDGSRTLLKGNPNPNPNPNLLPDQSRSKRIVRDFVVSSSSSSVLVLLRDFVIQLLSSGGYNVLMRTIRDDFEMERCSADFDITVFFQVAQFVMSFQYSRAAMEEDGKNSSDVCGRVAETMTESMFFFVFSRWREAFDGLKQTNDYRFLAVAGSLIGVMIRLLDLVLKISPDSSMESQVARVLLYKLLYDQTDEGLTQFLLNQMRFFDSCRQPKSYLADLLESLHVILRLMENLQDHGALRVSKKSRKKPEEKPEHDDGDDDDDEAPPRAEVEFKVASLISASSNNVIIGNLCWLLKFYKDNALSTNHYIVRLFQRICDDLDLSPLFFQLSLVTIFFDILAEQKSDPCEEHENVVRFLTTLMRRMLRKIKKQPFLFVDLLFHKSRRLCADIHADSLLVDFGGSSEKRSRFAESAQRSRADALGEDEADVVLSHDEQKQDEEPEPEILLKKKRRLVMNDEKEKRIRELHDKYKDQKNCSSMIAAELDADSTFSAAQVSRKLIQLGLLIPRRRYGSKKKLDDGDRNIEEDEIPLSQWKKNQNYDDLPGGALPEHEDDEVPLSQWNKNKRSDIPGERDSDDEVLVSIMKRSKIHLLNPNEGVVSIEEAPGVDKLADDLEDSDNELPFVATAGARRRSRMILDLEDE